MREPLNAPDDATEPLTLQQAATRHGAYRWVEHRLFELTGAWSAGPGLPPSFRLHLFEASAQHAAHAARWYDRLPVLATVDRDELTRPVGPVLASLVGHLAVGAPGVGTSGIGTGGSGGGGTGGGGTGGSATGGGGPESAVDGEAGLRFVAGLYRVVLPRLLGSYRQHAARLSPVADEPSRLTVAEVVRAEEAELAAASALLDQGRMPAGAALDTAAQDLELVLKGAGESAGGVSGRNSDGLVPWSDSRCAW